LRAVGTLPSKRRARGADFHRSCSGPNRKQYRPQQKISLLKFAPDELSLIVEEFGLTKGEKAPRLPLFTPEVLVNLSSNPALGTGPKERLTQALHIGLPLLAKVMRSNQENDGKREALDFCLVAELAQIDPSRLIRKNFSIEESGIVQMAN
jgi:hypothetical protein